MFETFLIEYILEPIQISKFLFLVSNLQSILVTFQSPTLEKIEYIESACSYTLWSHDKKKQLSNYNTDVNLLSVVGLHVMLLEHISVKDTIYITRVVVMANISTTLQPIRKCYLFCLCFVFIYLLSTLCIYFILFRNRIVMILICVSMFPKVPT